MLTSSRALRALLLGVVGAILGVSVGITLSAAGGTPSDAVLPRDPQRISGATIVRVSGSAAYGYAIHHLNGTVDHPETRSEALAECLGYDTVRGRARCRGEVTTWYADLAVLKQSTDYYRRLS